MICLAISLTSWFPQYIFSEGRISGSAIAVADHRQDLVLADNHVIHVVELDLAAGVLAHQDAVARLDLQRRALALIVELARADGDDLGLLRLFLGGVRDDDPAPHLLLLLDALYQDPIV